MGFFAIFVIFSLDSPMADCVVHSMISLISYLSQGSNERSKRDCDWQLDLSEYAPTHCQTRTVIVNGISALLPTESFRISILPSGSYANNILIMMAN